MKILAELTEKSVGISEDAEDLGGNYRIRKATRAVLFDEKGNIAFQEVAKRGYHKLPGGGIDPGETIEEALKREIIEEVGCDCEIDDEIGVIIEYRNKHPELQISYCYTAHVVGEIGTPAYEQGEIDDGMAPLWLPLKNAISKLENDTPDNYQGRFIVPRDLLILQSVKID